MRKDAAIESYDKTDIENGFIPSDLLFCLDTVFRGRAEGTGFRNGLIERSKGNTP